MGKIDITAKTERELLIMVAEQANDMREDVVDIKVRLTTLNGTVSRHDRAIAHIEGLISGFSINFLPHSKVGKAGVISGSFFIVSLIACGVKAFGSSMGWW